MLIAHKDHNNTIQVYSVTVMTHVKALQAGQSSQGTSEPITPAPILDVRNSLSITFLAISDQYANFVFEICIFVNLFYKMAAVGHFGCPKFTLDHISGHFRSIQIFLKFLQNICQWPFWMSENHFRSYFWPFQIDTQLYLFFYFWQNDCRRPFWMSEIHFG